MNLNFRRPDWNPHQSKDEQLSPIHQRLHVALADTMRPFWAKFPNGCEHIALLSEEIVDNRFLRNDNTKHLYLELELGENGEGFLSVVYDGVSFNDLEATKRSAVVEGIIKRLSAKYETNNEYKVSGEKTVLSENPKTHSKITFTLKD